MQVVRLTAARLAYGHVPLLDGVDLTLEARERVGLIGRNGSGKSSLLKVLCGAAQLDDGALWLAPGIRVARVPQEPALDPGSTVYDSVALGLGAAGTLLADYHHAAARLTAHADDAIALAALDRLQATLDASDGWTLGHRVDTVLSRLGLPADAPVGTLSGGWQKRVALAQALAASPPVLLLDEPTNHLDFDAIAWLEDLLCGFPGAVLCVTHDRRFLDAIATRIVELDRGRLQSTPGSFATYQERKARELADETVTNAKADKVLAQEEAWIRKGIEARRTRNEGRVRRLEALRRARAERRERLGRVTLKLDAGERSGKAVAELDRVVKGYAGQRLIDGFSTRIIRGDRVGLLGPNGAGKTTLLKLILGEIDPDAGTVRRGTNLAVAYFDQMRAALDPDLTLQEAISAGSDFVTIGETRRHVLSYLGDFLFPPERARSPLRSLSGGERNRLLLARLFSQPANVLVLDEPTNDLDLETLELLEALLQDYSGTLFLVSHDRAFLDNVVTQTIAFEGGGRLQEYAGGYSDWAACREALDAERGAPATPARRARAPRGGEATGKEARAADGRLRRAHPTALAARTKGARCAARRDRGAGTAQRGVARALRRSAALPRWRCGRPCARAGTAGAGRGACRRLRALGDAGIAQRHGVSAPRRAPRFGFAPGAASGSGP